MSLALMVTQIIECDERIDERSKQHHKGSFWYGTLKNVSSIPPIRTPELKVPQGCWKMEVGGYFII